MEGETMMNVKFLYKGKSVTRDDVSKKTTTVAELKQMVRDEFHLDCDDTSMKLLYKGKVLGSLSTESLEEEEQPLELAFPPDGKVKVTGSLVKILVMASNMKEVKEVQTRKSDPTIRGFDNERNKTTTKQSNLYWGPNTAQDRNYKFCRIKACTWQSFGHRADSQRTPHVFEAISLLERMATDPGIVAIMKDRELVVNTLGEMDPIDDRIMQKQQEAHGGCVLGYNTNRGLRIDIKLRSDDLQTFRPYPELVATLIHELSHNWVSEHDHLFWTNYGQMRVEYLNQHSISTHITVNGKTTANLAGVTQYCKGGMQSIYELTIGELRQEMMQHGISPDPIAHLIQSRCNELLLKNKQPPRQIPRQNIRSTNNSNEPQKSRRELMLEAAERRTQKKDEDKKG